MADGSESSDEWRRPRPDDAPTEVPTFEIPLTSDSPIAGDDDSANGPSYEPNWRKVVGLSSLAGVVIGVGVGVVLVAGGDDEPDTAPTTTVSEPIAPPPTLAPPATLPPPGGSGGVPANTSPTTIPTTVEPIATVPVITTFPRERAEITVPTFLPLTDPPPGIGQIEFAPAVAALDDDVPRRSTTVFQSADQDDPVTVTIVRDPTADRDQVLIDQRGSVTTLVVDHATDSVFLTSSQMDTDAGPEWVGVSGEQLLPQLALASMRELIEPNLLGPIRPDTFGDGVVTDTGELVGLSEAVPVARRFVVSLPGASAGEWIRYVFDPRFDPASPAPVTADMVDLDAYVAESGELAVVAGEVVVDGIAQAFSHRLEQIERIPIELPDPERVTDT